MWPFDRILAGHIPEIDFAHATKQHRQKLRLRESPAVSTLFESAFSEFSNGLRYLVVTSSLVTFSRVRWSSTKHRTGLIAYLRQTFATFVVPEILSSDRGIEFTSSENGGGPPSHIFGHLSAV